MLSDLRDPSHFEEEQKWSRYLLTLKPGGRLLPSDPSMRAEAALAGMTGLFVRAPLQVDVEKASSSGLAIAREAARRCSEQLRAGRKSRAELVILTNEIGKIRLATKHETHVVMLARAITAFLMARLRCVKTNSRLLRNKPVELNTTENLCVAYSSDLSKATDEIGTPEATELLDHTLKVTGAPRWMLDAAQIGRAHV